MVHHQNAFIKYFEPLFREIKQFVYFQHFIHDELNKRYTVTGINAAASSLSRKSFTIQRINDAIKFNNVPLEVKDNSPETNNFTITLKQQQ